MAISQSGETADTYACLEKAKSHEARVLGLCKEISYIHAEGYAAGEMKHGPIALIDENFPTLAIALDDKLFTKNLSNLQEIQARNGPVILLTHPGKHLEQADRCELPPYHRSNKAALSP